MTLSNSISGLFTILVGVSKASMAVMTKWGWGISVEPERIVELGMKNPDDWSYDRQLLFDDLIETVM